MYKLNSDRVLTNNSSDSAACMYVYPTSTKIRHDMFESAESTNTNIRIVFDVTICNAKSEAFVVFNLSALLLYYTQRI